jgi:hypothetical protein
MQHTPKVCSVPVPVCVAVPWGGLGTHRKCCGDWVVALTSLFLLSFHISNLCVSVSVFLAFLPCF